MTPRELYEEGVAPPPPDDAEEPAAEGQDPDESASDGEDAPDAGEIEWAGGLIKRPPHPREEEPR